jgi:hypothetical protein
MDWTLAVDGYCERLGPEFWAEPINAVTNAAFLIAAALMWRRTHGLGRVLVVVLALIGIGSFLFHTYAQPWAGLLDVLPIVGFVLIYIFAANRDFWGFAPWPAFGVTLLFFPFAAATIPLFNMIPALGSSAAYGPVPLLILIYAVLLANRLPDVSRGLTIGASLLIASLTARTLDLPVCDAIPHGTHFLWHILNAIMLAWMIEVWQRHMLAGGRVGR